ncbi:MAG: hypothetical protein LLG01_00900 [Planctomycetaceae bacterium]|nr:hypothetical protein [Planctomycetaceae bacterium]
MTTMQRMALMLLLLPAAALAQNTGNVYHRVTVLDDYGEPALTSVEIYLPGTTTLATIYKDRSETLPITQPMTSASTNTTLNGGTFSFWGQDSFDYRIKTAYLTQANTDSPSLDASHAFIRMSRALALDTELYALSGLTSAANKLPYFTGSGTAALTDFTAFGRSILDDADEATFKATVNLEIGTDVQAYDADLTTWAGITPSSAWQDLLDGTLTTNANAITVKQEAHLNHVYDVRDYGADPADDGGDDGTELQAALTAAGVSGGTVGLVPGTYKFATGLTIPDGVSLIGLGGAQEATLEYTGHDSALTYSGCAFNVTANLSIITPDVVDANAIKITNACRNCTWENLNINGKTSATNSGSAFYFEAGTGWTGGNVIRNVYATAYKYGALFRGAVHGTGSDGVASIGDKTFTSASATFTGHASDIIQIGGAGVGGAILTTRIATVTSASEVELETAPSTSVDPAAYNYGDGGDTATTTQFSDCQFTGYGSPYIAGSTGVYFDVFTNGVGTTYIGGTIEGYSYPAYHENGGFGGKFVCDMEGNENAPSLGASFQGEYHDAASGDDHIHRANGTANEWMDWLHQDGETRLWTRYSQKWIVQDAAGTSLFDVRWGTIASSHSNFRIAAGYAEVNEPLYVKHGADSAGAVDFYEDSDNGTNYVRLQGPASTADVTINIPAAAGTMAVSASAPVTLSAAGDIGLTVAKDLVAGTGLSGGADDILPGADADVTLSIADDGVTSAKIQDYAAIRLLGSAVADMQAGDAKTTVYTVPAGKSAIVTMVIVRNPSDTLLGGSDFDLGDGANADTWKQNNDLTSMTATTDCIVIFPAAKFTVFDAGDAFGIKPGTGATADATATVMVYGIEF